MTRDLDLKVSDFGVSYWSQFKEFIPSPKCYIGGKSMYETSDDGATIQRSFDLRYVHVGLALTTDNMV